MISDYVDNWDRLPVPLQSLLEPIIAQFDDAADQLFDRRLNLSFEAAVRELSIPGIIALTSALRDLHTLLNDHITILNAQDGVLLFDREEELTAYDLPFYTPCLYLSQLSQYQEVENVRVWKESTGEEIIAIVLTMARFIRPDIETARVAIGAIHDMTLLYPNALPLVQAATQQTDFSNAQELAQTTLRLLKHRL